MPVANPYYDRLSVMLHANGVNGSTTFTNSSSLGLAVTKTGSPFISTTQSKFGGASIRFPGSARLSLPANNSALAFGQGDFSVGFFARFDSLAAFQYPLYVLSGGAALRISINTSGQAVLISPANSAGVASVASVIVAGTMHYFLLERLIGGTFLRLSIDGTAVVWFTDATNYAAPTEFSIGGSSTGNYSVGYIDEFFVIKGAAIGPAVPTDYWLDRLPQISGNIKDASGSNAARLVRAYRETDGAPVGSVTSNGETGDYTVPVTHLGACTLNAYPAAGESLPALALRGVVSA